MENAKNKSVGLAVCYDTKNFGSQLQVLSTLINVEKLGYSAEIINYKKTLSLTLIKQTLPRFFNPYFLKNKCSRGNKTNFLKKNEWAIDKINIRNARFNNFVEENFNKKIRTFYGWNDLKTKSSELYSTVLCGSDQLWLPSNLGSHFYTLEFAKKDVKKVAYATSFGVKKIPWFQKIGTQKFLKQINHISCREESGRQIVKNIANIETKVVADPTLLLDKTEWDKLIPSKNIIQNKYIFCYFLGNNFEHRKIAKKISDETGLPLVTIPFLDNYNDFDVNFGNEQLFDVDAFDFINLIKNAEYVLTDSFHGSVFSILYEKKFLVFNRFSNTSKNSRNSRIDNLCALFDLQNRRCLNNDYNNLFNDIDYTSVLNKVEALRKDSIKYLKDSLEN